MGKTLLEVKAAEWYLHAVLFIILYQVVRSWNPTQRDRESVSQGSETPVCHHLNESCRALLSCGAVYYAVQFVFYFDVGEVKSSVWPLTKMKAIGHAVLWRGTVC